MTDKNLFSAIGNIDEKYIEEAADDERARPRLLLLRYVAAAAAFLLVISASLGIFMKSPDKSSGEVLGLESALMLEEEDGNPVTENESAEFVSSKGYPEQNTAGNASVATEDSKGNADSFGASSVIPGGTKGGNYSMVQINLENERFYRYLSNNDLSELNIKPINNDILGEKIGVITSDNCNRDFLIGCEIFSHKQIACDAIIILKNGDELIPFVFLGFRHNDRDFSEILNIYGAGSSSDIEKITTRGLHDSIDDEKVIADSTQIKAVYDILTEIHADDEKNDKIKKEYHQSDNKTYIYFTLHFKNGFNYQSFYRVYPDMSYIENHDFLTSEQDEILRNILLK